MLHLNPAHNEPTTDEIESDLELSFRNNDFNKFDKTYSTYANTHQGIGVLFLIKQEYSEKAKKYLVYILNFLKYQFDQRVIKWFIKNGEDQLLIDFFQLIKSNKALHSHSILNQSDDFFILNAIKYKRVSLYNYIIENTGSNSRFFYLDIDWVFDKVLLHEFVEGMNYFLSLYSLSDINLKIIDSILNNIDSTNSVDKINWEFNFSYLEETDFIIDKSILKNLILEFAYDKIIRNRVFTYEAPIEYVFSQQVPPNVPLISSQTLNGHILISGTSGSGKSSILKNLLRNLKYNYREDETAKKIWMRFLLESNLSLEIEKDIKSQKI